jgi:hypothetical protein
MIFDFAYYLLGTLNAIRVTANIPPKCMAPNAAQKEYCIASDTNTPNRIARTRTERIPSPKQKTRDYRKSSMVNWKRGSHSALLELMSLADNMHHVCKPKKSNPPLYDGGFDFPMMAYPPPPSDLIDHKIRIIINGFQYRQSLKVIALKLYKVVIIIKNMLC